jgi:hypothetical protein
MSQYSSTHPKAEKTSPRNSLLLSLKFRFNSLLQLSLLAMTLAASNHEHETLRMNYTRQSLHLSMQLVPPAVIAKGQVVTPKFLFLIYFGPLNDSHRGRRFEHDDEPEHSVSEELRHFSKGL